MPGVGGRRRQRQATPLLPHIPRDERDGRWPCGHHPLGCLETLQARRAARFLRGQRADRLAVLVDSPRHARAVATHAALSGNKGGGVAEGAEAWRDLRAGRGGAGAPGAPLPPRAPSARAMAAPWRDGPACALAARRVRWRGTLAPACASLSPAEPPWRPPAGGGPAAPTRLCAVPGGHGRGPAHDAPPGAVPQTRGGPGLPPWSMACPGHAGRPGRVPAGHARGREHVRAPLALRHWRCAPGRSLPGRAPRDTVPRARWGGLGLAWRARGAHAPPGARPRWPPPHDG